ncbi:MAG: oligopeptidase A [Gammaproteobacteria bacterium]|nr:MAG: oligopeptidase A [Gammaproteobacteria bacterium]
MTKNIENNPLLNIKQFPDYASIAPEHALPAIKHLCQQAKNQINELLANEPIGWETYEKLEAIDNKLSKAWSPVSHLHAVMNSEAWRAAYQDCQPIISQYGAEMSQHSGLYAFYCGLRDSAAFADYDATRKKLVNDAIRDFELSGVSLSEEKKAEYQRLVQSASELYTTFSNNVLDATQSFHLHISDEKELVGIPDSALALYRQLAQQNEVDGFWLTLDFPSYLPALTYADNRQLREKLYYAYNTRASELSDDGAFDNTAVIKAILAVRSDLAELLGFAQYADLSLANKMAQSATQVRQFLTDLVAKSKPQGQREYAELVAYGKEQLGIDDIQPWDVAYISEKLKQAEYAISQEQLRNYFPVPKVIDGLFAIVGQLFQVTFAANPHLSKWHNDVQSYTVKNADGAEIAYFYMDLYARQGKNGGAWMNGAIDKVDSRLVQQKPVAYLTCNFIPPTEGKCAYLSHDEVVTLFHEFGHGLHHMLTTVKHSPLSGINGVEWDAVELPSQFMENFCFTKKVLDDMSAHKDSGETLPDTLFNKLTAAKNYHSALMMLRQLEFSLFDITIHSRYDAETPCDVMTTWRQVRQEVAVTPVPDYARFPMSFSHIFAGGYAAGYFSYKWAEVLSADAFARFEEEGVYNETVGAAFKNEILQRGASRTAMENFVAFRGREPDISALLRHNGIAI